jgi:hypothetical protein
VRSVLVLDRIDLVAPREHLGVLIRSAVPVDTCARWVRSVMAARTEWTSDFEGEQFALGRAFYTHFETGKSDAYFRDAPASDARVQQAAPGLQEAMRALVAAMTGARVVQRRGWCGPGVHVFPASEKVARSGGVVHFDVEGLGRHHLDARKPALSLVVMLQPPLSGGGLRLWDCTYHGSEHPTEEELAAHNELVEYDVGDALLFDSYRLHQVQPFEGARDRVTATVHAAEISRGVFESWF